MSESGTTGFEKPTVHVPEIVMHFDTETTGLNVEKCALIQLSGIITKDGKEVERFNFKVRPFPNDTIQVAALRVNGHKLEEIMEYPMPKLVHKQLENLFQKYIDRFAKGSNKNKVQLCAYNAQFDAGMLRAFYKKCDDKWFGARFFNVAWDSMSAISKFVGTNIARTLPNQKLATMAEYIGVSVDKDMLHDAMYDVILHKAVWDTIYVLPMTQSNTDGTKVYLGDPREITDVFQRTYDLNSGTFSILTADGTKLKISTEDMMMIINRGLVSGLLVIQGALGTQTCNRVVVHEDYR